MHHRRQARLVDMAERFDGMYGRAYDALVSHPVAMRASGRLFGRATALAELPGLVRSAYEAAPGEPLLDVPCGAAGSLAHAGGVQRTAHVVGLDLAPAMLERGRRRVRDLQPPFDVELVEGDALDMPFDDAAFGAVLSINGLHCMPDPDAFVAELARVTRPDGTLTMTTLVDAGTRASRFVNDAFRRGGVLPAAPPSLAVIVDLLESHGWTDVEVLGGTALVALRCTRA
jgi:ubiquinone/menaquinone biosynthesis C-methylase UbiE